MALQALNYTIEVRSPLVVAGWREAYVIESLSYVPGAVVRGSLARLLLADCPLPQDRDHRHPERAASERSGCPFYRLFYAGAPALVFHNAYPGPRRPVAPVPATARSCKREPGFTTGDPRNHGVFDTLVSQAVFRQAVHRGKPLPFIYEPECSRCAADDEEDRQTDRPSDRFYIRRGDGATAPRPLLRRFSRTAVARERHAVAEGLLYTVEAIDERMDLDEVVNGERQWARTIFQGQVLADDSLIDEVSRRLAAVRWLGSGRSRGLGRVVIAPQVLQALPAPPTGEDVGRFVAALAAEPPFGGRNPLVTGDRSAGVVDRLLAFNRAWHSEWSAYACAGALPADPGWYFTVDLLADAVLREGGAPTLRLSPALLGLAGQVELVQSFGQGKVTGGWSEAAGLPKETALAVAMGAVYLYRADARDEPSIRRILLALHELEQTGVGAMREVGFGQVQICSPFHLEVNPL